MKKAVYEMLINIMMDHRENDDHYVYNLSKDSIEIDEFNYDSDDEYYEIPYFSSEEAYGIMVLFTEKEIHSRHEKLFENALNMDRPFFRFNNLLRKYNYEGEFYNFKRALFKTKIDEWMKKNGITFPNSPLNFPNWEKHFSRQILERGRDYYHGGLVENVKVNRDNISAKVYNYKVNILYKDSKLIGFSCGCPCNFNCKHEAALMYYVTSNEVQKTTTEDLNLKEQIDDKLPTLKFDNDVLLDAIKRYFVSDDADKEEHLKYLLDEIIYCDYYNTFNRARIIDYLIDKAAEYKNYESLKLIFKTSSEEQYKDKITDIFKEKFSDDEEIKNLLDEQNIINNFLLGKYE